MGARNGTRQKVLDLLIQEADMDGITIIADSEIGRRLGIVKMTVGEHIRNIEKDGDIKIVPKSSIDGRFNEIHILGDY